MKFRPCIDIHDGKVKQLVGSTLSDQTGAKENFVSERGASYYAGLYRDDGLFGGHVVILNADGTEYFDNSRKQAIDALRAFPGGLQLGGGVNPANAPDYIEAGASHVIVTSFVFKNGIINYENLKAMTKAVGRERLVLDLSCKQKNGKYFVVTDRWQKFTDEEVNQKFLSKLSGFCDEFLIHGVDSEGKYGGMDEELVLLISGFSDIPVTYAGGISSMEQITKLRDISGGRIDFTVGSGLDLFGGSLKYDEVKKSC